MTNAPTPTPAPRLAVIVGLAAIVGLVAIVAAVSGAAFQAQAARDEAANWERHSLLVQLETTRLLSALQDAETGQRGYLITHDTEYLQPYYSGSRAAPVYFAELARLTRDNPRQQSHMRRLWALIDLRLKRLAAIVPVAESGDYEATRALVRQGKGKLLMDAIRAEIGGLARDEQNLLVARQKTAAQASETARLWFYALNLFGVLLLVGAVLGAVAALRARREGREALHRALVADAVRAELQQRVEEATSELQIAEEQLRQAQKMEAIGQLTGGIAHDFNNMLAVVLGSLQLAERRLARGQSDIERYIANAIDAAERAATLTQRLLAFARQQPLAPTVVDINGLVSGMSELLRRTLGENIRLETVLSGGLWRARADPHQLESAILNLAVNGRDAVSGDGKLTVETANAHLDDSYCAAEQDVSPGQYVVVAVTDTGAGMAPGVVEKAFDPFFTTKEVGQGTGLGLSQVFGFVKQSGGHVKIYSELGHGTTVKVYLPRHLGEQDAVLPAPAGAPPGGTASEIILVVEDEDSVRLMSVEALRDLGYTVRHASSGAEALAMLDALPGVGLLFTDVVMPGMNGRTLAEAATARVPGLKVLYTTGYTSNAVVHNGALDPGVALLSKPFTVSQLAGKVRQAFDN